MRARDHAHDDVEKAIWDEAVDKLAEGDYYLSVFLNPSLRSLHKVRPPHDRLKLWLTAFGIVLGGMAFLWTGNLIFGQRFWDFLDWLHGR